MSEEYGIKTFLDNKEFDKGLSDYLKGLDIFTSRTQKSTVKFNAAAGRFQDVATGRFVKAGNAFTQVGKQGSAGLSLLAVAAGQVLANAFQSATRSIQNATAALVEFGTESLQVAGKVDELQRSALFLGQQAGYSNDQMLGFFDSLEETGIRADVSGQLLAQLARYNIDLAKATDLASVAQNAGVLVGRDSSEVLDSLTRAAVTNQIEVARSAGITVNFTDAQEKFAQSIGTSRENLTAAQKTQANFNAILEEGAKIQGVYKVAMDSPTKALRSLGREIFNLQAALGAPFLDAWATVIGIVRSFVQDLTTAVKEGGVLYPILINLGAAASILADGLAVGAQALQTFAFQLVENMTGTLENFLPTVLRIGSEIIAALVLGITTPALEVFIAIAEIGTGIFEQLSEIAAQAVTYGANIVVSLAEGIIQAATTVLVTAMNYIGSILSSWLSPGSPPKVAPDLDKWGAAAMAEWLRGFTEADFNVLSSLEGQLQSALGEEGLAGLIDELMTAVNAGEVTEDIFSRIAKASGEYGDELAILVEKEIAYAEALEKANAANERLEKSQSKVATLQAEYNDLLRRGASPEMLGAKLDQINAAEKEVEAAKEQGKEAATNLDDLKDEANLQKELVKQLVKLTKLKERESAAGAGAAAGGGGLGGLGGGMPGLDLPGVGGIDPSAITTRIQEAIETAKQNLLNLLTGENSPFAPLFQAWNEEIMPRIETLKGVLFGHLDEFGEPVPGLIDQFTNFASEVSLAWDSLETRFEEARSFISTKVEEITSTWDTLKENVLLGVENLKLGIGPLGEIISLISETINTVAVPAIQLYFSYLESLAQIIISIVTAAFEQVLLPAMTIVWGFIQNSLMPLFQALADLLNAVVSRAIDEVTWLWENYALPIMQDVVGIIEEIVDWFSDLADVVSVTVGPALKKMVDDVLAPVEKGFDAIAKAVEWVVDQIGKLADAIRNLPSLPEVPSPWRGQSPPPLAYWMADIATATSMLGKEMQRVNTEFSPNRVTIPASIKDAGQTAGTTSYTDGRQANFHIGSINNGMDQASFENMADRWWQTRSTGRTF